MNKAPWTAEKILKKSTKHLVFFAISFLLGNIFLAYIIGSNRLFEIITDPPSQHLTGLGFMILFSLVFYWIYAYFREQVCTMVCPYGRLQGVLLDNKSIVVAYDFVRGEPRGKPSKSKDTKSGDCIDCKQCVEVCPTGIDIRNGTQLECVNCTACIDACNSIMDKIKKPRGLIRYDSYDGITNGRKFKLNPRIAGYLAVLSALLVVLVILFASRKPLEATILRTPGVLYQKTDDGLISNLFNIKILNKTFEERPIRIRLLEPQGEVEMVGGSLIAPAGEACETSFFVKLNSDKLRFTKTPLVFGLFSRNQLISKIRSSFIGPNRYVGKKK